MKRNYISNEFTYQRVGGTYNMSEQKSFFSSKMVDIEDSILIDDVDIIYYQNKNNEQIDEIYEQSLPPIIYSLNTAKNDNHSLEIDKTQTEFEMLTNTRYNLYIDVGKLIRGYIFSQLKSNRVFNGVLNSNTVGNDVDSAVNSYIEKNIIDRYEYSTTNLYLKYNNLLESGFFQSSGLTEEQLAQNKIPDCDPNDQTGPGGSAVNPNFESENGNKWDVNINQDINIEKSFNQILSGDKKLLQINFKQSKPRSEYNFDYYFDIVYKKL